MAITRFQYRNPWQELDQLTNRLGQLFNHDASTHASHGTWLPAVDVEESGDELVLTAEVPGLSPDAVELQLENNVLTISGERAEERREGVEGKRYHVLERRYGSFRRSFTLPRTVQPDKIAAEYRDGILTVRLPKASEAKSRRIQISQPDTPGHVGSIG